MGNQRLAAGKAWFRMTSPRGKKFVPGEVADYADLFTFDANNQVVLRPGVTVSHALTEIGKGRPVRTNAQRAGNLYPDEVIGIFQEGSVKQVTVNVYERDRRARERCLKEYGPKCCICEMSFGERYGKRFTGFIHVHHLRPLSEIRSSYKLDPSKDLRPVCPNCHSILHYRVPAYSIEEARSFLRSAGQSVE